MSAPPPRNDIAQLVTWDLSAHTGRQGVLEIVDGDTGGAYAWLAAGRFEPAVVPLPLTNPSQPNQRPLFAAELPRTVPLPEPTARFAAWFQDTDIRHGIRAAAAQTLVTLDAHGYVPLTAATLADTNEPAGFRVSLALLLAEQNSPVARAAVLHALRAAPQRLQRTRSPIAANCSFRGCRRILARCLPWWSYMT